MKWPWVSRSHHDAVIADHVALNDAFRAHKIDAQIAVRDANVRYADLLAKYHALKLQGASEPAPVAPVIVRPIAPLDPVKRAIRDQVRANPDMRGLEAYLMKYASELRALHHKKPDEIADLLGRWESSESMSEPGDSVIPVDVPDDSSDGPDEAVA